MSRDAGPHEVLKGIRISVVLIPLNAGPHVVQHGQSLDAGLHEVQADIRVSVVLTLRLHYPPKKEKKEKKNLNFISGRCLNRSMPQERAQRYN